MWVWVSTDTDTMIPVNTSLTCRYKKYLYELPVGIHFQYPSPTRCGFYPRIPVNTNFFDIPTCDDDFTADNGDKFRLTTKR